MSASDWGPKVDDLGKAMKNLRKSRQECGPITQDTQGAQEDQPADHVITLKDGSKVLTSYPKKEKPANQARLPKGKKAKPSTSIQKPKGAKRQPQAQPKTENSPYIGELLSKHIDIDIKAKLTLQELKFLEIYLSERVTIDNAMIQAGYGHYSKDWRYKLAQKIVRKYETQTEDKRNIFRDIGLGESKVAKNIMELAENARSEMVRLNANALAAKCLRLTDEPQQSHQGVNIIINCGTESGEPGQPPPARVVIQGETCPAAPNKPLQITK